jgi:hypothetical protein
LDEGGCPVGQSLFFSLSIEYNGEKKKTPDPSFRKGPATLESCEYAGSLVVGQELAGELGKLCAGELIATTRTQ